MRVNLVIGEGRPPLIARRLEQGCGDRDREEQAGVAPAAHPPHAAVGRAAPPENELRHHRDDSSEDHRPAEPYPPGGATDGERAGSNRRHPPALGCPQPAPLAHLLHRDPRHPPPNPPTPPPP